MSDPSVEPVCKGEGLERRCVMLVIGDDGQHQWQEVGDGTSPNTTPMYDIVLVRYVQLSFVAFLMALLFIVAVRTHRLRPRRRW